MTLDDYTSHLVDDGMANSLQVWLVSLATNTPINIVLEDVVWSTASTGIDFLFYMIILISFGMVIPCLPEEPEQQQTQTLALDQEVQDSQETKRMQGSCLLAIQALLDDGSGSSQSTCRASDMDMDIEFQFSSHIHDPKLPRSLGLAKTRVCLVCSKEIFSGLALI